MFNREVIHNILWLFFDKILRLGLGFFVTLFTARYYGPDAFGQLNYVIAFVGIVGVFSSLGLESILVKKILQSPNNQHHVVSVALIIRLIASFCVIPFVAIFCASNIGPNINFLLTLLIAGTLTFQSFDTIKAYFESQIEARFIVFATNFSFLIVSLIRLVLILSKSSLVLFASTYLIDSILSALGLLLLYHYRTKRWPTLNLDFMFSKELLYESWPLALSSLAVMIYMRLDSVMLGSMISTKEVGIYNAALRLSEIWYMIPTILTSSIFPKIFDLEKNTPHLFEEKLYFFLRILVIMAVTLSVGTFFCSHYVIVKLFGPDYQKAAEVLTIHIWTSVFVFLGVGSGQWFLLKNMNKLLFYRTFSGAILNVVLNILLIPRYGSVGAAYATLLGQASATYFFDFLRKETRPLFYIKSKALCLILK